MKFFDETFREIFLSQIVLLIGGLIAGTILAVYTDNLLLIPGMLVLIPGFLEMRGNISGSLAARISSGIYLGFINPYGKNKRVLRGNIAASFFLVVFISILLGVLAYLFTLIVFKTPYPEIILISLLAAILANLIEIPLSIFFTFFLFRKGFDPDNIMGPFVTTTGDLTSILSLLLVVAIL